MLLRAAFYIGKPSKFDSLCRSSVSSRVVGRYSLRALGASSHVEISRDWIVVTETQLTFEECKRRVNSVDKGAALAIIWRVLVIELTGFRKDVEDAKRHTLSVNRILEITPGIFKRLKGTGPATIAAYGALYQSLLKTPDPLDISREVTTEGLRAFDPRVSKVQATRTLNVVRSVMGVEKLAVEHLEEFISRMDAPGGMDSRLRRHHLVLLRRWLGHLKQ